MQLDFNQAHTIYVVDTSALIILESTFKYGNPVFKAIWEEIEELIGQGTFRTIDFVEEEINSVKTDAASIKASIPIVNAEYNTGFFDVKKQAEGKEEADPYLIGYCKVHGFVLITNESKIKHNRIPAVAAKNGVKCIDLNDFLNERGLRMERKK